MDELEQQDPHRLPEPEPLEPVEYERAAAPEPIDSTDRFPEAGDLPEAPPHAGITNREPVELPEPIEPARPGDGGLELPEPPEHLRSGDGGADLPEPIEPARLSDGGAELPEPPEHLRSGDSGVELPEPAETVRDNTGIEPPELVEQYNPRPSELPEPPEIVLNETKSYDTSRLTFHDDVFTSDTHWG